MCLNNGRCNMKVYKHKPQSVKASEIRYTRPDGSNAVVPIDWGEYDYLYNELDKVMGHDFTQQLREALEGDRISYRWLF